MKYWLFNKGFGFGNSDLLANDMFHHIICFFKTSAYLIFLLKQCPVTALSQFFCFIIGKLLDEVLAL